MADIHALYTQPEIATEQPRVWYSLDLSHTWPIPKRVVRTPNHQPVTRMEERCGRLLVWTRSRIYVQKRRRLRLWKIL